MVFLMMNIRCSKHVEDKKNIYHNARYKKKHEEPQLSHSANGLGDVLDDRMIVVRFSSETR